MRIIAVDDEKLALDLLVTSIRNVVPDAEIHGFQKVEDAVLFLESNECDVAFLDIEMVSISGLELAKRIRELYEKMNIIFVTGYSEYSLAAFRLQASDYLLKPVDEDQIRQAMKQLRNTINERRNEKIRIKCFGNFEVFCDEKPLTFKRSKTKELLAYLVDKQGASCTMGELIGVLWEDEPDSPAKRSNLRNLIYDLKETAKEAGVENIVHKEWNSIALNCDVVECDYYEYLANVPKTIKLFQDEYMAQYSWAEKTNAKLFDL